MIDSAQNKSLLGSEDDAGLLRWTRLLRSRKRVLTILVAGLAALALLASLKLSLTGDLVSLDPLSEQIYTYRGLKQNQVATDASTSSSSQPPRHFQLIAPASQANENLCKTLLSAAVLGYPPPTVVNWNKVFDNDKLIFGGSHIAKIDGVLAHLESLPSEEDDDLVLLIDGYDVWFQLRPDVLISRYYDINARADARIRKQLGNRMAAEGISQRVLFSAQKRCWPKEENHPACWAVPESSLPDDTYGPNTDTLVDDEKNPYVKFRPRYLNSGMALGPAKDLRAIFLRAKEKANKDIGFGSDQGIFAEIFGEQEFQRLVIAARHRSTLDRSMNWLLKLLGRYHDPLDPATKGTHEFMEAAAVGAPSDFGIGLDYESRILQTTVFSEYDTAWLAMNSTDHLRQLALEAGVEPLETHLSHTRLASDVIASRPPFDSPLGREFPSGVLPSSRSWAEVPLFLNLWTGFTPVAIHHNAHRDGLKGRIQTHWDRTWFQPYARMLLDAHVLEPPGPLAEVSVQGEKRVWWSVADEHSEKVDVTTDDGGRHHFDGFCNGTWAELFRDESGEWLDPRFSSG